MGEPAERGKGHPGRQSEENGFSPRNITLPLTSQKAPNTDVEDARGEKQTCKAQRNSKDCVVERRGRGRGGLSTASVAMRDEESKRGRGEEVRRGEEAPGAQNPAPRGLESSPGDARSPESSPGGPRSSEFSPGGPKRREAKMLIFDFSYFYTMFSRFLAPTWLLLGLSWLLLGPWGGSGPSGGPF